MSDLTTAEALMKARDLIADPGRWTQGQYARDIEGDPLMTGYDPAATCWCALGALQHVTRKRWVSDAPGFRNLRQAASVVKDYFLPQDVNDEMGHAATLEMYDRAIEAAR